MSAAGTCATVKGRKVAGPLRGRCEVNGNSRDCRILNLNSERAFVESFVPAIRGSKVLLHVHLPNGHSLTTSGVVTRHEFKSGFDVEFGTMSARQRERLNNVLA